MMDNPDMMRFALIGANVEKKLFRGKARKIESVLRDPTIHEICKRYKADLGAWFEVVRVFQARVCAAT